MFALILYKSWFRHQCYLTCVYSTGCFIQANFYWLSKDKKCIFEKHAAANSVTHIHILIQTPQNPIHPKDQRFHQFSYSLYCFGSETDKWYDAHCPSLLLNIANKWKSQSKLPMNCICFSLPVPSFYFRRKKNNIKGEQRWKEIGKVKSSACAASKYYNHMSSFHLSCSLCWFSTLYFFPV